MKDKPNKVTAALKVVITGEFYDDDLTEETLRYVVEQELEDAGFDVDVALLKEQETMKVRYTAMGGLRYGACPHCDARVDNLVNPKACGFCGQELKWE